MSPHLPNNNTTGRRAIFGAAIIALSMILVACGGSDDEVELQDPTVDSTDPAQTAVMIADQFDQALRALNDRYQFTTTHDVDGTVVSQIVGRNIDGNTTSTATAASNTIDVVNVGAEFWTRTGSGEWVPAAAGPGGQDPLASLLAVTEVTFFEGVLTITYPGAVLGFEVDWVTAEVTVLGPSIELVAVMEGLTARSTLTPAADLSAITAPV